MLNLISFGGQHQGVYGIPNCSTDDYLKSFYCKFMRKFISIFVDFSLIQKNIVQVCTKIFYI